MFQFLRIVPHPTTLGLYTTIRKNNKKRYRQEIQDYKFCGLPCTSTINPFHTSSSNGESKVKSVLESLLDRLPSPSLPKSNQSLGLQRTGSTTRYSQNSPALEDFWISPISDPRWISLSFHHQGESFGQPLPLLY